MYELSWVEENGKHLGFEDGAADGELFFAHFESSSHYIISTFSPFEFILSCIVRK